MVVGRLLPYWEGNFSGAMLNFRGVVFWSIPCVFSTKNHGTQDRSLEAPLGRELLTYQSPRQKRARAWINEFDVPNVKSPERDLGFH